MNPRTTDLLKLLSPIVLIVLGVIVNALGYLMITEANRDPASVQFAAQTMSRIAVLLVLSGIACGFLAYPRNRDADTGGKADE